MNPKVLHIRIECIDAIDLKEVMKLLRYSDIRSAMKWCQENKVFVLSQGRRQFVNYVEFTLAFYKPLIAHLKSTHKDWKERFVLYLKGDIDSALGEELNSQNKSYKPQSQLEQSFLQKLKRL